MDRLMQEEGGSLISRQSIFWVATTVRPWVRREPPPRGMQTARYLFVEGGIFLDTDPRVYSCHGVAYLCTDLP